MAYCPPTLMKEPRQGQQRQTKLAGDNHSQPQNSPANHRMVDNSKYSLLMLYFLVLYVVQVNMKI